MKIWITRRSAFQLQCGGVDRLDVWFTKPHFFYRMWQNEEDMMFSSFKEGGCREEGWRVAHGKNQNSISFAAFAGGDNYKENESLIDEVWKMVCQHFNQAPFQDWYDIEKAGKVHYKDFLLEIDLSVTHSNITLREGLKNIKE